MTNRESVAKKLRGSEDRLYGSSFYGGALKAVDVIREYIEATYDYEDFFLTVYPVLLTQRATTNKSRLTKWHHLSSEQITSFVRTVARRSVLTQMALTRQSTGHIAQTVVIES